jgi:glycosyltransferase involved in cell wall biosynthesis
VPSIVSIFDLMHRYERRFPEVSHGMKFLRRESHYKKICRYSAGLLVDSAVGREHVEVSYSVDRERVHVLPFIAPPHLDDVHDERDTLEVPGKFLFYPAQFWRHKNHIRLIRALAGLTDRCPDMQLVLAGSRKNNFEAVRNLISDLGLTDRVHILGYVSDPQIVSLYRRARALIMPTFFGPTNIPPLEAMALGCPVAASNIYAMPEQLGGAALMFDPNSVDDIAEAMYRLWTDDALCAELSRKGLERNAAWTQAEFSARLLSIVRRVAGSMARPRR